MAEIGAPKSQQQEGGKLASRIEPRTSPPRPPAGAQTIPARNPKAPLPPRVSLPDAVEAGAAPRKALEKALEQLEPESVDDIPVPEISTSSLRVDRHVDDDGELKTTALPQGRFKQALAELQRKPVGMPAPASNTSESTQLPPSTQDPLALLLQGGRELREREPVAPRAPAPSLSSIPPREPPRPRSRDSIPPPSGGMEKTVPLPPIPPPADTTRTVGEPFGEPPSVADLGRNVRTDARTEPFGTPIAVPPPPGSGPSVAPKSGPVSAPSSGVRNDAARANPNEDAPPNSRTLVQGALNLKPGSAQLGPLRTPSPMAIVGGSSLRLNPARASQAPTPNGANGANADVPPAMPMPYSPSTPKSVAPPRGSKVAKAQGPSTSPKSFAPPAGGPPASYERAFRQWSSPAIVESADAASGPVTFQVYTPQDIGAGRAPMRSLPVIPPKKPSFVLRAGLALLGGVVVFLTAAAVIAVSTEEPKRPTAGSSTTAAPTPAPEPTPSVISIGDPPVDDLPATPPATTAVAPTAAAPTPSPAPSPVAAPTSRPRPRPTTTSAPNAPASLRGMAPPPNPYGNK